MGRRVIPAVITAAALVAVLTGCNDSAPESYQDALGCTKTIAEKSNEIFAQDHVTCTTDAGDIDVYTFASTTARDNWVKVATDFGAEVGQQGANWVALTPDH